MTQVDQVLLTEQEFNRLWFWCTSTPPNLRAWNRYMRWLETDPSRRVSERSATGAEMQVRLGARLKRGRGLLDQMDRSWDAGAAVTEALSQQPKPSGEKRWT